MHLYFSNYGSGQRFLQVDSSEKGIGVVLAQGTAGEEKPVVFLSRKLLPRETRYSTIEKECLTIKWSGYLSRYPDSTWLGEGGGAVKS